jgi:hypothetical protein
MRLKKFFSLFFSISLLTLSHNELLPVDEKEFARKVAIACTGIIVTTTVIIMFAELRARKTQENFFKSMNSTQENFFKSMNSIIDRLEKIIKRIPQRVELIAS